jgi:hypothetical protein
LHPRADVWFSEDGRTWTPAVAAAPWGPRIAAGMIVYDERLWVLGGSSPEVGWLNDVWSSADGNNWERLPRAPWTPRAAEYVAAFAGRLWVYGGKGIEADGAGLRQRCLVPSARVRRRSLCG